MLGENDLIKANLVKQLIWFGVSKLFSVLSVLSILTLERELGRWLFWIFLIPGLGGILYLLLANLIADSLNREVKNHKGSHYDRSLNKLNPWGLLKTLSSDDYWRIVGFARYNRFNRFLFRI